jgi:voltage-gated sodium channel
VAEHQSVTEQLKRFTSSATFNNGILALIVLSSILVGIETYAVGTPAGRVISLLQDAILWVFVAEQVLKIAACGRRPWEYFRQGWNIFDLSIILICFLPLDAQFATVFRLARLLRTLRMVTILPRLQVLVGALLKSVPSLGYIGVLLALHFYVYAVAGTFLFRQNDPIRFGSLHYSMLTLFEVLTLEGWNEVLNTQYNGSDAEYSDAWKELSGGVRASHAQPLVAALYFVSFIMLGTMIMLNLFTGVIISSIEEAQAEQVVEVREDHLKEKGFLTLHDELAMLGSQLHTLSVRLKGLELKELNREEQVSDAEPPAPPGPRAPNPTDGAAVPA